MQVPLCTSVRWRLQTSRACSRQGVTLWNPHQIHATLSFFWLRQEAPLAGIPVHQRSLEAVDLKEALASGRYLAVALVDKVKLGGAGACAWGPDAAAAYAHAHGEPAYVGAPSNSSFESIIFSNSIPPAHLVVLSCLTVPIQARHTLGLTFC